VLPFSVKSLLEGETPHPPSTAKERLIRIHLIEELYVYDSATVLKRGDSYA
jgi:hypothetical protein